MPTTLVLVRHGETDWNRANRFQGHADPPLNERGRTQARSLATELLGERFAAAYTSPLQRALETATILGEELDLHVTPSDGLKEVDLGSWSGLTRDEVEARFPEGFQRWLAFGHGWDDGETYGELGARVSSELQRIAAANEGGRVLAVTHGGPIRSALAVADGVPFGEARRSINVVGNCAVVTLEVQDGMLRRAE